MSESPRVKRVCQRNLDSDEEKRATTPINVIPTSNSVPLHWKSDESQRLFYCIAPDFLSGGKVTDKLKIAAFDMDYTLITTKTGKLRPKDADDWLWFHDNVPEKLKSLHRSGFQIIIFTNQSGARKVNKRDVLQNKVEQILAAVGIPIAAFICAGSGYLRKPSIGVWLESMKALGISTDMIDYSSSFYSGDAAGRIAGYKYDRHGKPFEEDFSDVDRAFAENVKLHFMTPEEVFLGKDAPAESEWTYQGFDAKNITESKDVDLPQPSSRQEVVLLVGPPASGKTTLYNVVFKPAGYVWVNQDTLKTPAKCMKVFSEALAESKSVVIDRTNGTPDTRSQYISVAKGLGVPVRCIIMTTPFELAQHLNIVRTIATRGATSAIADVVYHTYRSKYAEPTLSEGFTEICHYTWRPLFDQVKKLDGYADIENIFYMKTSP